MPDLPLQSSPNLPTLDALWSSIQFVDDPVFTAWVNEQPDKHWAKYDLTALRLGYVLGRAAAVTCHNPSHRHARSDRHCKVLFEARMQSEDWVTDLGHAVGLDRVDMLPVIVYVDEDGSYWARPFDEFHDGRFEELKP